jgi:hypothetical protein
LERGDDVCQRGGEGGGRREEGGGREREEGGGRSRRRGRRAEVTLKSCATLHGGCYVDSPTGYSLWSEATTYVGGRGEEGEGGRREEGGREGGVGGWVGGRELGRLGFFVDVP